MTDRRYIDFKQLLDAEKLSQAEYFLKYKEHPAIILRFAKEVKK